jgi:hypothetical protein
VSSREGSEVRIGTLCVGGLEAEIMSVEFTGGCMVLTAVASYGAHGSTRGQAFIAGADGSVCWRGSAEHDAGRKLAGSVWTFTFTVERLAGDSRGAAPGGS